MSSFNTGKNLPPPQSPFVNAPNQANSSAVAYALSNDGYQFLMNLINNAATAIPTASVETGIAAAGSTQATATQLSAQWNEVDSAVGGGNGVVLPAFDQGQSAVVVNESGAALDVYPPAGVQINALGANQPFSLANGSRSTFDFFSDVQIRT